MKLCDILHAVDTDCHYDPNAQITDIAYDSGKASPEKLFVCLEGARFDGHDYAKSAYDNGCRFFLCQKSVDLPPDASVILCEDTRAALAVCSCNLFSHPSRELSVIGITGTKGKTTMAHIIQSVLNAAGIKTGIIGTVGAAYGDVSVETANTTPESYELQRLLRLMADDGCAACVMEVSSLGLKGHRVDGIRFKAGIFTNLYPDHIGGSEHKSLEEYSYWKTRLFPQCEASVVCIDDAFSDRIIESSAGKVITYGYNESSDYRLLETKKQKLGGVLCESFAVESPSGRRDFTVSLPGEVNAHNAVGAVAAAEFMGVDGRSIEKGLERVFVKGRAEVLRLGTDYTIVLDYAHNAVSLKSILETVGSYEHNRLIALYGSVGGRAQLRRRELGLVSGSMCDFTIITSDDPDFEDPQAIMRDIAEAVDEAGGKYVMIADRAKAIDYAIEIAEPHDIFVFAGKGHEQFMKVRGEKLAFSEKEEILKALERRRKNV